MALRTDEVQLRVLIDGSPARKELAELNRDGYKLRDTQKQLQDQERSLRAERAKHAKGSPEYKAITKDLTANKKALDDVAEALKKNETRQAALRKEIGLTALSAKELRAMQKQITAQLNVASGLPTADRQRLEKELVAIEQRLKSLGSATAREQRVWAAYRQELKLTDLTMDELEKESTRLGIALRNAKPGSAEMAKYRRELGLVKDRQDQLAAGGGKFTQWVRNIRNELKGAAGVLLGMFVGNAIFQGVSKWVSGLADSSDKLTDMAKATNKTDLEVRQLDKDLSLIATKTRKGDLRDTVIGLGLAGVEATVQTVAAIDKVGVALGDAFEGGRKEITNTLAVVRNNLSDFKTGDFAEDVGRIGNAFNVLEAAGLATGPVLADITNRTAGVARTYKIASGAILGMAATFPELGINQERGSTAYVKALSKMAAEPEKFRAVVKRAGLDVKKFNKDLNEDMQSAFLTVAQASRIAGKDNTAFGAILKELDEDGAGASELLSKIGANQELVARKTKLATDALKNQDSITAEFNKKNTNLLANLEKIGKWLEGKFISTGLADGLNGIVRAFTELVSPKISEGMEIERQKMQALYYQVLQTNEGSDARVALIRKLQEQYPGYLQNLDAEKVTNDELRLSIEKLNKQMINKIILQQQQEEIDKLQETAGEKGAEFANAELQTLQMLAEQEKKYGVAVRAANSTYEQAAQFKLDVIAKLKAQGGLKDYILGDGQDLNDLVIALGAYKGAFDIKTRIAQDALNKKMALENLLNLQDGSTPSASPGAGSSDPAPSGVTPADPKSDKAAAKVQEQQDAILKILTDARERVLEASMSADERELAQLDVKHREELANLKEHQTVLIAQKVLSEKDAAKEVAILERDQINERVNLIEQQDEKRADAAREAQEALFELQLTNNDAEAKAEVAMWDQRIALAKEKGDSTIEMERSRLGAIRKLNERAAESEVMAQMKEFDRQVALYDKAGVDTRDLVKRFEQIIADIKAKYRLQDEQESAETAKTTTENLQKQYQEKITLYQSVGTALSGLNSLFAAAYAAAGQANYENTLAAKALGLAQIAIATGVGVAEAIKAGAGIPYPANLGAIASGVGAVLAGIANAISLLSAANVTPPKATTQPAGNPNSVQGIVVGEKGLRVIHGPSHADGGLDVVDPKTGERKYNIEGGETLVAKDVSRANPELMDELMSAAHRPDKRVAAIRGTLKGSAVGMAIGGLVGGPVGMAIGGVVGGAVASLAAIPVKKQRNPGYAGPVGDDAGDSRMTAIPVKKQRSPGVMGRLLRGIGAGAATGMAMGGLIAGPFGMALGGMVGSTIAGLAAIPVKKQRNPGYFEPLAGAEHEQDHAGVKPKGSSMYTLTNKRFDGGGAINSRTGGGVIGGSLHSDGGNDLVDTRTGEVLANMERDELVLVMSRKATAANADLIPMMLHASRAGQRMNFLTEPLPRPSRETMRIVHMASGGMVGPGSGRGTASGSTAGPDAGTGGIPGATLDLSPLEKKLDTLIERTEDVVDESRSTTEAVRRNRDVNFRFNQNYNRAKLRWDLLQDRNTAKRRRA